MAVETQGLGPLESYQELTAFARRCGENALRLAMHAAVPQSFRADLLHLLKLNFLPDAARDPAVEADVLLADFTEDLSGGYYRFDTEVRRQLLDRLDAAHPQADGSRLERVARFLAGYVRREEEKLEASADPLRRGFLEIERWVALAHLDPDSAARQLAHALDHAEAGATAAVRLQLGGLIRSLSAPLAAHPELLIYAAGLRSLEEGRFREGRQMLQRLGKGDVQIAGVKLRPVDSVLSEWKDRFEPASREDAPPAEQSTILIVSESDTDFWTQGALYQRALDRGFHLKVLSMSEVDFTKETEARDFVASQSAGFLIWDERHLSPYQNLRSALFGLADLPVVPVWRPRPARAAGREIYISHRLEFGWWAQTIEIPPGVPNLESFEKQLQDAVTRIRVWAQDPANAVDVAKQHFQFFRDRSDNPFERFESIRLAARELIARGETAEARDLLDKVLAALQEIAPVSSVSMQVQTELAQLLVSQGETERARELMERAMSALREPGAIKVPFAAEMQTLLEKLAPATSNFDPAVQFAQQAPLEPNAGQAGAGRVFISHAVQDERVASSMIRYLEDRGIRCWVPHREFVRDMHWPQEFFSAISECGVFVVILSQAADASSGVAAEIRVAIENRKTVIPVRIDPSRPSAALLHFVEALQWLDATHDWESHLPQLYERIKASIGQDSASPGSVEPDLASPILVMCGPQDRPQGRSLESVLNHLGYTVWFGAGRLVDNLRLPSIEQARTVLILWSRNSADYSFLLDGAAEARDRGILIPVLLDDSPLPEVLRNLHAASLVGWSGDSKDPAFESLTRIIWRRTQTAVYEEPPPPEVKQPSLGSRIRGWFTGDSAPQENPPEDKAVSLIVGAKIYINYRPDDAEVYVHRLRDDLTKEVGRSGEILMTKPIVRNDLERKIRQCQVMLVLIGKGWLSAQNNVTFQRLLDIANDFVRREIEIALENYLIVIPVLLGHASFPPPDALPSSIRKLAEQQYFALSQDDWHNNIKTLTRIIALNTNLDAAAE